MVHGRVGNRNWLYICILSGHIYTERGTKLQIPLIYIEKDGDQTNSRVPHSGLVLGIWRSWEIQGKGDLSYVYERVSFLSFYILKMLVKAGEKSLAVFCNLQVKLMQYISVLFLQSVRDH